jgi:hypothetical protein
LEPQVETNETPETPVMIKKQDSTLKPKEKNIFEFNRQGKSKNTVVIFKDASQKAPRITNGIDTIFKIVYGSTDIHRDDRNMNLDATLKRLHQNLPRIQTAVSDPTQTPPEPIDKSYLSHENEQEIHDPVIAKGYRCITAPKKQTPVSPSRQVRIPLKSTTSCQPTTPKSQKYIGIKDRMLLEHYQTVSISNMMKIGFQYDYYRQQQERYDNARIIVTRAKVDGMSFLILGCLRKLVIKDKRTLIHPEYKLPACARPYPSK